MMIRRRANNITIVNQPAAHNGNSKHNITVYIALVGVFISAATALYTCGVNNTSSRFDKEKNELKEQNDSLRFINERLYSRTQTDSIERLNWVLLNTTNIKINTFPNDLPTLEVATSSIDHMVPGWGNGNWKTESKAIIGDTIAIQFYYHNTGDGILQNVGFAFDTSYLNSHKTFICKGGITVGNQIVKRGLVKVKFISPSVLHFIPGSITWYPNQSPIGKRLKDDSLWKYQYYNLGDIQAGWQFQGVAVLNFVVEKYSEHY